MTETILEMMEERRKNKHNSVEYLRIQKLIRKEIREAKEKWLEEKCHEIKTLENKHDSFNVDKKVREFVGTMKRKNNSLLKDKDGKLAKWKSCYSITVGPKYLNLKRADRW